jgi:hypothetical protein
MPKNLRKTLEKAEGDLITEVKEWIRDATTDQMRELLTVLIELEEVEVEDEEGNAVDNPFSTLQEFAVTWAQLNNLLVQVEAAEPEDDEDEDEEAEGEPEKPPAETPKAAAPQKLSGRKGTKHRHCCEIGRHEAEASSAAAESKSPHPPPASL